MPVRPLSHLVPTTLAVSALCLGVTASALAVPSAENCACGGARLPQLSTPGPGSVPAANAMHTDPPGPDAADKAVRAPEASKPIAQRPPTWPANPEPLSPPRAAATRPDAGFQWDDAGVGAAGALVVVLTGLGAVAIVRRRGAPDDVLPA
jgi:hypothetical protein